MTTATDLNEAKRSPLGGIIWFCLHNKLVVFLLVMAIMTWGVMVAPFDWQVGSLPRDPVPVDAIPDIGENQQIVFTEWMGRSPQDVEDQIGYPMTVALLGIPEVKTIRSYSMFGFSIDLRDLQRESRILLVAIARAGKAEQSAGRNAARRCATDARTGRHGTRPDSLVHARRPRPRRQTDRRLGSARVADDSGLVRPLRAGVGRRHQRSRLHWRIRSGIPDRRRPRCDACRQGVTWPMCFSRCGCPTSMSARERSS